MTKYQTKVKLLTISSVLGLGVGLVLIGGYGFSGSLEAGSNCSYTGEIKGWAWSGYPDDEGVGWISLNGDNYGVKSEDDCRLSGHAWANPHDGAAGVDNIGWLSFEEDDLQNCPAGQCQAWVEEGQLHGWARFLAADKGGAGGWHGWVSLSGETDDGVGNYGAVLLDQAVTSWSNFNDWSYAWGGEYTVGYIGFAAWAEAVEDSEDPYSVRLRARRAGEDAEAWDFYPDQDDPLLVLRGGDIDLRLGLTNFEPQEHCEPIVTGGYADWELPTDENGIKYGKTINEDSVFKVECTRGGQTESGKVYVRAVDPDSDIHFEEF